jgi:hypothetical protein
LASIGKVVRQDEHVTNAPTRLVWIDGTRTPVLKTPGELLVVGMKRLVKAAVVGKTLARTTFAARSVCAERRGCRPREAGGGE